MSVYADMTAKPPLQRSDRRINGANDITIKCYGLAELEVLVRVEEHDDRGPENFMND